ncbi:MAG: DUF11 domain-containing protein [Thermoplasmata archaeon]|nr:DUF11 domain-containing protein [Thermoplasmata archaeon]
MMNILRGKGKIMVIFLAILMNTASMSLILFPGGSGYTPEMNPYSGGSGTIVDPYMIENVWELQNMTLDLSAHYALKNDIDATSTIGWNFNIDHFEGFEPVGDAITGFTGSLEGNDHIIYGLFIDRSTTDDIGLFGVMDSGASVNKLRIMDFSITGARNTGSIAGQNNGDFTYSTATMGTVDGTGDYVGGLIGTNGASGSVTFSLSSAEVSGDSDFVGGLMGANSGTLVERCSAHGNVTGAGNNVGGLIGMFSAGTLRGCHSTGNVMATGGGTTGHGGLIGSETATLIEYCHATGDVDGGGDVGGLIGLSTSTPIATSYAKGNVTATGDHTGGLVGRKDGGSSNNCYAWGNVSGGYAVGGLIGYNKGTVAYCYAIGTVTGTLPDVGALVGVRYNGGVNECYYNTDTSGSLLPVGVNLGGGIDDPVGYSTPEMMLEASYPLWDFATIWGINETFSYPYLLSYWTEADLEITMTDSADPTAVGETLHYNVTIINYGPGDATLVNVTVQLPAEVTYNSDNQTGIHWGQNNLSWEMGDMMPNKIEFWNIDVTVDSEGNGTLYCIGQVNSTIYDKGLYLNETYEVTSFGQEPVKNTYDIEQHGVGDNSWIFVSFPITASGNVLTIFDDAVWGDGGTTWDLILWYDPDDNANHWKSHNKNYGGTQNIPNVDNTMGVWVHLVNAGGAPNDVFLTVGEGYDPVGTNITLQAGWNMVGFPSQTEGYTAGDLKTDSSNTVTNVERYNNSAAYDMEAMPDGDVFQIGQAYWVYSTTVYNWVIP